jgi:hypothetical protein
MKTSGSGKQAADTEKKPFDKKKWRERKYSHKFKGAFLHLGTVQWNQHKLFKSVLLIRYFIILQCKCYNGIYYILSKYIA